MRTLLALLLSLTALSAQAQDTRSETGPLAPLAAEAWDLEKAAHLLRRAGFGGAPHEIARLALLTPEEAVASLVHYERLPAEPGLTLAAFDPSHPDTARQIDRAAERRAKAMLEAARQRAMLDLEEALQRDPATQPKARPQAAPQRQRRRGRRDRQPGERFNDYVWRIARLQSVGNVRNGHERRNASLLRGWWLARMAATQRPLEEKMTLFWHGHFATGFETVRNARHMQLQNQTFRQLATGSFKELVRRIARDPAMLRYLDGNRNIKGKPNENFARELMELFTLGRDQGYTEQDIKQAARCFTGWSYRGDRFVFNRRNHDTGQKTFLGKTGKFDGDDVIDILFERPELAQFIGWKLARFFVSETPDEALVEALASKLRASDYQLKPVLTALFRSRAFYDSLGRQIKSPTELVVGMMRALELDPLVASVAGAQLGRMGQLLLQPPNVKGWDGGRAWVNSATLLIRYNFARDLVVSGASLNGKARQVAGAPPARQVAHMMARQRDRRGSKVEPVWPLGEQLLAFEKPEAVVDHLLARLLTRPVGADVRARMLKTLAPNGVYDPKAKVTISRLQRTLYLITSLPQFQLG